MDYIRTYITYTYVYIRTYIDLLEIFILCSIDIDNGNKNKLYLSLRF